MAGISKFWGAAAVTVALLGGCDMGADVIGPEGGVVTSPDGRVTLEIPAGALDEEIAITIGEVDDGPDGAVGRVYEVIPRLTMLAYPAEITYDYGLPYEDTEALSLAGVEMDNAELVSEGSSGWSVLSDHAVDTDAEVISASVMFFSTYAVVVD